MNHSVIYLISELRPVFFPDALKILRISPTSKSGDQENISNYSPISLLRCFPKIPVQIMYDRLYNYLANEKIFNPRVWFSNWILHRTCNYKLYRSNLLIL